STPLANRSPKLGQQGLLLASRLAMNVNKGPAVSIEKLSSPTEVAFSTTLHSSSVAALETAAPLPSRSEKSQRQPSPSGLLLMSEILPPARPDAQVEAIPEASPDPTAAPQEAASSTVPQAVSKLFQRDPFAGTRHELPKSPTSLDRLMAEVIQEQNEWAEVSDKIQQEDALRAAEEARTRGLEEQRRRQELAEAERLEREERERKALQAERLAQEELRIRERQQRLTEEESARRAAQEKERQTLAESQRRSPAVGLHPQSPALLQAPDPAGYTLASASATATLSGPSVMGGIEWLRRKQQEALERENAQIGPIPTSSKAPPISSEASIANSKSKAILAKANSRQIFTSKGPGGARFKTPSSSWSPPRRGKSAARGTPRSSPRTGDEHEQKFGPRYAETFANSQPNANTSGPFRTSQQNVLRPEPMVKTEVNSEERSLVFPPAPLHDEHETTVQSRVQPATPETNTPRLPGGQRTPRIPRQELPDPISPERQLTTIYAEDEPSSMAPYPLVPRGVTPAHLPPPLWHSGEEDEMAAPSSIEAPANHLEDPSPKIGVSTTYPILRLGFEAQSPQVPPRQFGQFDEQNTIGLGISHLHQPRISVPTVDPRLARLRSLQKSAANAEPSHVDAAQSTDPQNQEVSQKSQETPSHSVATQGLPTGNFHNLVVSIPPASPIERSVLSSHSDPAGHELQFNPLAGRSYGPNRVSRSSEERTSSSARPDDFQSTGFNRHSNTAPLPSPVTSSSDMQDQTRKRGRTGDEYEQQAREFPPPKRQQTDPRGMGRVGEAEHRPDRRESVQPYSSDLPEQREFRGSSTRGRGRGFVPRGRGRGAPRGRGREYSEDYAPRSGYGKDYYDDHDARSR
ncbi:hypothetical protein FRB90_008071, partial [Tulasnella sp. 427]